MAGGAFRFRPMSAPAAMSAALVILQAFNRSVLSWNHGGHLWASYE